MKSPLDTFHDDLYDVEHGPLTGGALTLAGLLERVEDADHDDLGGLPYGRYGLLTPRDSDDE